MLSLASQVAFKSMPFRQSRTVADAVDILLNPTKLMPLKRLLPTVRALPDTAEREKFRPHLTSLKLCMSKIFEDTKNEYYWRLFSLSVSWSAYVLTPNAEVLQMFAALFTMYNAAKLPFITCKYFRGKKVVSYLESADEDYPESLPADQLALHKVNVEVNVAYYKANQITALEVMQPFLSAIGAGLSFGSAMSDDGSNGPWNLGMTYVNYKGAEYGIDNIFNKLDAAKALNLRRGEILWEFDELE